MGDMAAAQNYPTRAMTMIVPFPPGVQPIPWRDSWPRRCGLFSVNPSSSRTLREPPQPRRRPRRSVSRDGYTLSIGTSTTHMKEPAGG